MSVQSPQGMHVGCAPSVRSRRLPPEPLYHPGWLRARYVRDVMTLQEVAAVVGVSRQVVARALERYGIPRRRPARRIVRQELTDAAWLRRRYVDQRLTTVEIAAQLGVAPKTVNGALRRLGIAVRPPRHHRPKERGPQ
jgi:transposase